MDKASIGRKIREARLRLGLTQLEFANRIGCSYKALSSWERGIYLVDVIMLKTIADICGMTINDFTDETELHAQMPTETQVISQAEKQLIEKIRCLRADKKKAIYVFFGVREDK